MSAHAAIASQPTSSLYQWMQLSTFSKRLPKGQEYAERLDALDKFKAEDSRAIFKELDAQLLEAYKNNSRSCNREAVLGLTAKQCKAVLLALHKNLRSDRSNLLNTAGFKAVNVYDSERAKGKLCALYEYMREKNLTKVVRTSEARQLAGSFAEVARTNPIQKSLQSGPQSVKLPELSKPYHSDSGLYAKTGADQGPVRDVMGVTSPCSDKPASRLPSMCTLLTCPQTDSVGSKAVGSASSASRHSVVESEGSAAWRNFRDGVAEIISSTTGRFNGRVTDPRNTKKSTDNISTDSPKVDTKPSLTGGIFRPKRPPSI